MNKITASVIDQLSTIDNDGKVTAFDLAQLDVIIAELRETAKAARISFKDAEKKSKEEENAKLAERGKLFYKNLAVGDEFSYVDASGNEWKAVKIETKSKSGSTAACELIDPPAGAKNTKRYPKFHQVAVPADWEMPSANVA